MYFCAVNEIQVRIIEHANQWPTTEEATLLEENFFHSWALFLMTAKTPRQKPYMAVAQTADGQVIGQLLAIVRYRASWFPPYFFMHCRILSEGAYSSQCTNRSEVFAQMLHAIRNRLGSSVLFIEVSNLNQKMFGYREFRKQHFFPVHWMSIHNSLHSRAPEERISQQMHKRIVHSYARGVVTEEVTTDDDFRAFSKLLHHHNWLKPKRYIPHDDFFRQIQQMHCGRLYVTKYREMVIGCSAVVYSGRNAYLWYSAFRRKSFAFVHPDIMTIWHSIKDSHHHNYDHIFFLDVGLPFRKNPFREFILRFGGKPVSTYRWFHVSIGWVNTILSRIYRD